MSEVTVCLNSWIKALADGWPDYPPDELVRCLERAELRIAHLEQAFDQATCGFAVSNDGETMDDYNPFGFDKKMDGALFDEYPLSLARKAQRKENK